MPKAAHARVQAFIGLGANLGNPVQNLLLATRQLRKSPGISALKLSSLYRTSPVDATGPDYVNAVAQIRTDLPARQLLELLLDIEQIHGRQRSHRNAPRTLDLDLLLYNRQTIQEPDLIVPHPRMHERAFVLLPLMDLAPDLVLRQGTLPELLVQCADQVIQRIESGSADT